MRRSPAVTPAIDVLPAAGGRRWKRATLSPVTGSGCAPDQTADVEPFPEPPTREHSTGPAGSARADAAPDAARQAARAALTELSAPEPPPSPAPAARAGFSGRLAADGRPVGEHQQSPERQIAGLMHELRALSTELDAVRQRAAAERERLLDELAVAREARLEAEAEVAAARQALATGARLPAPRPSLDTLAST